MKICLKGELTISLKKLRVTVICRICNLKHILFSMLFFKRNGNLHVIKNKNIHNFFLLYLGVKFGHWKTISSILYERLNLQRTEKQ